MDKDQTILQTPMMDTDVTEETRAPIETRDNLILVKGKDDPTTILPFSQKLGGDSKKMEVNRKDSLGKSCLTPMQTEYL